MDIACLNNVGGTRFRNLGRQDDLRAPTRELLGGRFFNESSSSNRFGAEGNL
jgi:hypothetical protein